MLRLPVALRSQVRCAHTRAKKINVQLLKEPYGRRLRGEVFPVSEGHMRLKLHPEGIAAYVRPNQPTPLPILSAAEAQSIRREMQAQAKAKAAEHEQALAKQQQEQASASERAASASQSKVQTLLDSLEFPSSQPASKAPDSAANSSTDAVTKTPNAESPAPAAKQFDWQNDMVVNITNKK